MLSDSNIVEILNALPQTSQGVVPWDFIVNLLGYNQQKTAEIDPYGDQAVFAATCINGKTYYFVLRHGRWTTWTVGKFPTI